MNAFEPKLNLVVNTGKVKQTFNMGMRFLTEDLYRRSTTRKNPSVPGNGFDAGTSVNNFNNYTAVYVSDEINFNNGMLTITPGLRYTFLNYDKKMFLLLKKVKQEKPRKSVITNGIRQ